MYHVMSRGIERGRIFIDEDDYSDLIERFSFWLRRAGGKCLAWCLMPNHIHFLLIRGNRPLSEMMHHVMTGYAVNYNSRHQRAGHLFQNRYKAIICEAESYFFKLVPYIHLNPVRASIVGDLADLATYKWCGHASMVTGAYDTLLDRAEVLSRFGGGEKCAVEEYKSLMAVKARSDTFVDLSGGGLLRSSSGSGNAAITFKSGEKAMSDQRILGGGSFVELVLRSAGETDGNGHKSRTELLSEVENWSGIRRERILAPCHDRKPARARAIYCYLAKVKAGTGGPELMQELKISQSGISRLISKGRELVETLKIVI
jgi:REP element-mobilizing transposase RayT